MIPDFATVFGGVGDGTTNNDTAFTNAEASAYERIWLPEGDFLTTKIPSQFSKRYEGPGRIKLSSGGYLQGFAALSAVPAFGVGSEYGESGNVKFTDREYKTLRAGTRTSLEDRYYQAGAYPHFSRVFSQAGESGTTSHLAATATAGATTATLNSVEGLAVGDQIGFQTDDNAAPLDTVTITAINAGAKVITFTPALANTYTYYGSDYVPRFLSGYLQAPQVTKGRRTMGAYHMVVQGHAGAGDSYIWLGRMAVDYTPKAGQTDFFDTATGGLVGGDIVLSQDGVYATGWECLYQDKGKDVAVMGRVENYERTNDTGARRVTWIHDRAQSKGSKPIDVFYSPAGPGRVGLDLTQADVSSDGQRAIQLKSQQRIYFDAESANTIGSRARGFWGNVQGDSYLTHNTDGSGQYVDLVVGTGRLRTRAGTLDFNAAVTVGTTLGVGTNLSANGNGSFGGFVSAAGNITAGAQLGGASLSVTTNASVNGNGNFGGFVSASGNITAGAQLGGASLNVSGNATVSRLTANADLVLGANKPLYLNGAGGGTYIIYESGLVVIYRGGVPVASF